MYVNFLAYRMYEAVLIMYVFNSHNTNCYIMRRVMFYFLYKYVLCKSIKFHMVGQNNKWETLTYSISVCNLGVYLLSTQSDM